MRDPYVCGGCGRRFRSLEAFDAHRTDGHATPTGRGCTDPATLLLEDGTPRFELNDHGEWHAHRPDLPGRADHWR